jgi:hypothetical protein
MFIYDLKARLHYDSNRVKLEGFKEQKKYLAFKKIG